MSLPNHSLRVSDTPSPLPSMPSPAITSNSCGGGGLPADPVTTSTSTSSSSVSFPLAIQQTAFSYVNITTLFLGAHETWDHAEKVALGGSGEYGLMTTSSFIINQFVFPKFVLEKSFKVEFYRRDWNQNNKRFTDLNRIFCKKKKFIS